MKFLLSYKLFEKTSLIGIGVPYSVMQSIQKNYAISDDAKWKTLKYKKDINSAFHKPKNTLIISISKNRLFILFSYDKEFYLETYILTEKDDFSNEQWYRVDRVKSNLTDITKKIEKDFKSYQLISGDWTNEFSSKRKIREEEDNFETLTNNFKKEFAENFTKIVKMIYGRKADAITEIIINNLKKVQKNISDSKIREILFINADKAKEVDKLKKKEKEKDPFNIYDSTIKADSLSIFDEYLIRFESEYSDKYSEYLNIPVMIEKYGIDKINTAFLIFIYSKKLIKL